MKNVIKILLLFGVIVFAAFSCEEEETPTDCGCNSEILRTIPDTTEVVGQIRYKEKTQTNSYYTNKYWIAFISTNCSDCVQHLIVCNESLITDDIINLINTQELANIKFSGHIKEVCEKRFDIASISYNRITLTKIELQ